MRNRDFETIERELRRCDASLTRVREDGDRSFLDVASRRIANRVVAIEYEDQGWGPLFVVLELFEKGDIGPGAEATERVAGHSMRTETLSLKGPRPKDLARIAETALRLLSEELQP